ncbi:MAG: hypothetical protein FWD73_10230 [Polyangiaceae bacterium]|nr:hypothetical protein [Polyangiaceae bacterium]
MKRGFSLLGSLALFGVAVVACAPVKEPQQVSSPDPVIEDSRDGEHGVGPSRTTSPGSPTSSANGRGANAPSGGVHGSSAEAPKSSKALGTQVGSLAAFLGGQDGLKWGMSRAELTKLYTQPNGIISKDYDEKLMKARVGPEMNALEAEREQQKAAFARSLVEFKDIPTGYDTSGIKNEYTYRNSESLMWVERQGRKRYFFFFNDRLWKIYDEVPLYDSGEFGSSYDDAVRAMTATIGVKGRIRNADASKGPVATTVDWKDGVSHLRLVDRSGERVVAIVMEDIGTLNNLGELRRNKVTDPTAIEPSVSAVIRGVSDPDAARPAASAAPAKAAPKKKK